MRSQGKKRQAQKAIPARTAAQRAADGGASMRSSESPEAAARRQSRKRRRRRKKLLGIAILTAGFFLLVLVIALVVLHITGTVAKNNGSQLSFLAVQQIEVEGETRYSADDIARASGIYVGESLLVVNKVQAHDAILRQFPYLERVEVSNSSFSTIHIRVEETTVLGAVQTADGYAMLGQNNHRLENLPEEQLPEGTVRIYGAAVVDTQIGGELLEERSLRIVRTLLTAAQQNGVDALTAVDLTEKTNIQAVWRNQILLVLGNESNLEEEMRAFQQLLPTLLKNNGERAMGRLDMSSYSDDDSENNKAVFSPLEKLPVLGQTAEPEGDTDTAAGADSAPDDTSAAAE